MAGERVLDGLRMYRKRYRRAEKPAEYVDWIFFNARALMVFHAPKSPSTADCVVAAQTVVLASMTMGLGTCYIGHARIGLAHFPEFRDDPTSAYTRWARYTLFPE